MSTILSSCTLFYGPILSHFEHFPKTQTNIDLDYISMASKTRHQFSQDTCGKTMEDALSTDRYLCPLLYSPEIRLFV